MKIYSNTLIFPTSYVAPSIAQLVERRTVEVVSVILRSLVRIRLEGHFFFLFFFRKKHANLISFFNQNIFFCFLDEIYTNYYPKKKSYFSIFMPFYVRSLRRLRYSMLLSCELFSVLV